MSRDGGPAFPRPFSHDREHQMGDRPTAYLEQDGMSLRAYFAGKALGAMVAKQPAVFGNTVLLAALLNGETTDDTEKMSLQFKAAAIASVGYAEQLKRPIPHR